MTDERTPAFSQASPSDDPLTPDQLLMCDNVIRNQPPPEALKSLISPRSLTFLGENKHRPELKFERVDAASGFTSLRVEDDREIVYGIPGAAAERHSFEDIQRGAGNASTAPHRPDWADLVYHPKMAGNRTIESLRRINGHEVIPHYVFGSDDRQVYYPRGYPWHCIGKVLVWNNPASRYPQWTGSGVLVGRNVVLTAGHMAPWGAKPWMMQFVPAFYDGGSTLGASVYSYVQSYHGYNTNDHVSAWDMLVMKLYDPLGDSLGYLGTKAWADNWTNKYYWTLCGYPGAVANAQRPSKQGSISIHDDDEDGAAQELETHNGDSSPGDSGGPLFAWWNDGPSAIGTMSGEEKEYQFPFSYDRNNVAAGGNALNALVRWARNTW